MRKLTPAIFVLPFILVFFTANAQLDEFDLSDFKLPDLKRHRLDIATQLNSNFQNDNRISDDIENKIQSMGANIDLRYSFYRNSEKYQGNQVITGDAFYQGSKYDNTYSQPNPNFYEWRKYNYLSGHIGVESDNRFYFNGLTFLEADMNFGINRINRKNEFKEYIGLNTDYQTSSYKDNSTQIQLELPVYLGYGRIERVEDARHAIFIMKDLERLGQLKRYPTTDEILEYSKRIAEVKNKRFFDSRLRKIEELKIAHKFLVESGLADGSDIAYFTSLNDMWVYGDLQTRLSGFRFYGGVIPVFGLYRSYDLDEVHYDSKSSFQEINYESEGDNQIQRLLFSIGFDYHKPIKQKWQYSLSTSIRSGPSKSTNSRNDLLNEYVSETSLELTDYLGYIQTGIGFYPNTRTYLSADVTGFYNYDKGTYITENFEQEAENTYYSFAAQLGAYYYISPKLRISGQYSFMFTDLDGTNSLMDKYDPWNYFNYYDFGWSINSGDNVNKTDQHFFHIVLSYSIL